MNRIERVTAVREAIWNTLCPGVNATPEDIKRYEEAAQAALIAAVTAPINEISSAELASLAGEVLQDPGATEREKRLAGSVLTQFDNH